MLVVGVIASSATGGSMEPIHSKTNWDKLHKDEISALLIYVVIISNQSVFTRDVSDED